jgi:hypothetical protein
MPSGYPGSGPKKQGPKKAPKKNKEKSPGAKDRKPHNLGEALVPLTIKPQGATREGAYGSDGNQNNGSVLTGHPWRQLTVQPQQMPPWVPASNLSNFVPGADAQPQQMPGWNPGNFAPRTRVQRVRDPCAHLFPPYPQRASGFDESYSQGQEYSQRPASYQANYSMINGIQEGSNRPFSYPTPYTTNAPVVGPSHSDTGAQSAVHGYNRQAMPYSAQHPGVVPYRNDYTQTYPSSVPAPPPSLPSGAFTQPPAWYTMSDVQIPAAQQHPAQTYQQCQLPTQAHQQYQAPAPPPAQATQEYHFSNYTPIDQYQGVVNNAPGNLAYNNPHMHAPAPFRPASNQAPDFILADCASEPSVPVDARSRKRRRNTTRDGSVNGEVLDEAAAGPSTTRGWKRHLARQAQRTAEDARALVELATMTVEAQQERQVEKAPFEGIPAEYRREEEVSGKGLEGDKAEGPAGDPDNGRQDSGDIHDSGYHSARNISQEGSSEDRAGSGSTDRDNDHAPHDDEAIEVDHPWDEFLVIPSESDEQEIEENGKDKHSG